MSRSKCTTQATINFAILALIRGSTPLMMWFALMNLHSAGLVVAIKCGITLVLFGISAFWYLCRDQDSKLIISKNLRSKETYWKIGVIGLLQSAVPYILIIYSLKHLPPSLLGVFMVITPWWSALFERLPFVKGTKIAGTIKAGMIFGTVGIVMMLGPVIKESIDCVRIDASSIMMINTTTTAATIANLTTPATSLMAVNNNNQAPDNSNLMAVANVDSGEQKKLMMLYDVCRTPGEIGLSILFLFLAPVMWGIVSVFWKFNRKDTHMLVSSFGQNLVGCVCGIIFYFVAEHRSETNVLQPFTSSNTEMYVGVLFLGVLTGWLATLLVQHLYVSIGSKTTNQVLTSIPFIVFVEDSIFVRDVITIYPWVVALEVLGVLLVTVGVFVSNMTLTNHPKYRSHGGGGRWREGRDDLSSRLLDEDDGVGGGGHDYGEIDDDEESTSGFYTSHVGPENKADNDYANYEPPPMVITNSENEGEEELDDGQLKTHNGV